MSSELYIGIMSGTSMDGADAVLADFSGNFPRQIATASKVIPSALKDTLIALNQPGDNEIDRSQQAAIELVKLYGDAVQETLSTANLSAKNIAAIGCHGQTVRHRPDLGYTVQLNAPALLAELTDITVVADFRSRDVAAGGRGAPLVPAFHAAVFRSATQHRVVVNIGGIANFTNLPSRGVVTGYDTGPGNILMDGWISRHLHRAYDCDGAWARTGHRQAALLARLLAHPYFARNAPKSTGRDDFHLAWLDQQLLGTQYTPEDVQATLVEFTARTISDEIKRLGDGEKEVFLCGGGAQNYLLAIRLSQLLPRHRLALTDELGIATQCVEPLAFAWLARQTILGLPGNLPDVTAARHMAILGAIYRA
ncbi:MAG: anhydro-N-acetylmuramic acid kinase [Burkholderiales bacterium]